MALSLRKPGKLHAICARLHQTQGDSNGWSDPTIQSPTEERDPENNNVPIDLGKTNSHSSPPSPENSSFSRRSLTSVATEGSNSRRKNRKSAVPRNLAQVNDYLERFDEEKDELMEYKINNLNSDFPPINSSNEGSDDEKMSDEGDENGVSNDFKESEILIADDQNNNATQFSSGALEMNSITCGKHDSENVSAETRSEGVLDLSIQKVTNGSKPNNDEDFSENSQSDNDEETSSTLATEKNGGDVDVAYLKSYAERTMNEFLKMYGFSGDSASALTEHMALQKFALGKMLQGSEGLLNSPAAMMPFGFPLNKSGAVRLLTSPAVNHPATSNGRLLNTPKFSGVSEEIPTSAGSSPSIAGLPLVVSPLVSRAPSTSSCDTQGSMVTSPSKVVLPDYSKYIRRYSSAQECGGGHCCDMGYREHFHCLDCNFKVFVRKEEMIRHFKWHKKRDDSLQHGFMRYSPLDDCSKEFGVCTHNGRQTHYHCLQSGCDKVYISTSDVQMHANYHRKDSAIIQEGFQRFRATEDCGTPSCAFYGQRTTHFHCRRQDCRFTFKNKADMEKHKSYHQKDEILGRDGFKKFMKYEHCPFPTCRFSKISNHIHCIRPGCDYVLHSTGQLYSHKRKHERRDFESAYRRFKENQKTRPVVPKAERPLHPAFGAVGRLPVPRMPNFDPVASMATPIPFPSTNGSRMLNGTPVKKESEYVDIEHLSQLNVSEENSLSGSTSPVSLTTSVQSDAKADSQVSVKVEPEEMDENGETSSSLPSGKPATGLAAYNDDISGDQLNDSLTLPIPKYTDAPTTDTPQTSPQLPYTPNQSPPKTPLPLTASGLSTPVGMISSPGTASVGSANSTPGRDWPPRLTMSTERKPRDESWKAYIERYTANDPCNSRCQYLYKDHYHCKVENCTVLFKSKDAVREHARYHELQERITAMAYTTHESFQTCPQECELSQKHKHYHCVWTNCSHVILDSGPIFSRLEHYRIHEYARASAGKSGKMPACKFDSPDFGKRRRGRPPKYPKSEIPVVPKVELSEEELTSLNMAGKASDGRLVSSFKKFDEKQPCPDELCLFYCKSHFHCARPRCHHATDREDVLNLHTKDFHSFVDILEGFEFFDRNVNCRRLQCHNNKANRHFHCIRPRCDYSFVRHTTMAQHEKKHAGETDEESGDKINQAAKRDLGNFVPIAPAPEWRPKTVVKAAGTFYPISTIGHGLRPSGVTTHGGSLLQVTSVSPTLGALSSPQLTYPTTTIDTQTGVPLTVLLQKKPDNQIPLPSWSTLRAQMHFGLQQNCARPFCKLKKKDHYHCLECNQAFSDPARLRSHIGKHGIKLERVDSGMRVHRTLPIAPRMSVGASDVPEDLSVRSEKSEKVNQEQYFSERNSDSLATSESEDSLEAEDLSTNKSSATASSSLNLNPASFSDILAESQQLRNYYASSGALDQEHSVSECDNSDEDTTPLIRFGRKRSASDVDGSLEGNSSSAKQAKLSGSSTREEDGSVPQGYSRYRFTEDCGFDTCVYRQTLTHYHCERADCGYSFSNRTRVVQHTQRHERIDGITGNEFRQYRGNVDCQHVGCEYRNRSSHFHCLLCAYVCMDAAQVLAHRKHHLKMNKIISQGFQKFSGAEDCKILTCTYYYKKQTHYHCTEKGCTYVVLSPSQMASHKMKHMRDNV